MCPPRGRHAGRPLQCGYETASDQGFALRVLRLLSGGTLTSASIVLATVLSYALGWAVGIPLVVPVFNTLAAFPFMVAALSRGDVRLAVARMLVWALALAVCATLLSYAQPWRTDTLFLRAAS